MRIAINLLYLIPGVVGGTETYAAGLLRGLAAASESDEFLVFVNREAAAWPLPDAPNFQRIVCPVSARRQGVRYAFEQFRLGGLLRRHGVNLVHSCGYVAPLRPPCPSVVTIHDLNYRAFGGGMPVLRRVALAFFVRQSALRASRVLTVSDFSRREIAEAVGLPRERIVVTPNAPRISNGGSPAAETARAARERLGIRYPYILAFSSQSPNKNIPRLLEAFTLARRRYELPQALLLVGHPAEGMLSSAESIAGGAVHFTGYLDEADLQAVLSGAQMLAFPSVYEGFGLPVLEAMALGVPVVCSNRASLPEVAGDAAVFFDPYVIDDIAEKLASVVLDARLREGMIEKGYANVGRFSWETTARRTLQVYREAAA